MALTNVLSHIFEAALIAVPPAPKVKRSTTEDAAPTPHLTHLSHHCISLPLRSLPRIAIVISYIPPATGTRPAQRSTTSRPVSLVRNHCF